MNRHEETLLAILGGFLLAFGIHELLKTERELRKHQTRQQTTQEIAKHWQRVGGYIRQAQQREDEHRRQKAAA